jgi:hypothetical protein
VQGQSGIYREEPTLRIAFSGGQGSGKTTLANFVVEKYGVKHTYLNQTRRLINTMYKGDLELARKDNFEFQTSLLSKKIYWERKHKKYGFVTDRTTLDNIAYFLTFSEHDVETREVWKYITKGVTHAKEAYDIIFCLSPLLDTPEDPLSPPSAINKYKVYFTVCGLLNLIEATHPHIVYYIHIRDLEGRKCLISNIIEEKLLPWISSPS